MRKSSKILKIHNILYIFILLSDSGINFSKQTQWKPSLQSSARVLMLVAPFDFFADTVEKPKRIHFDVDVNTRGARYCAYQHSIEI